jgi:hypothetical protein
VTTYATANGAQLIQRERVRQIMEEGYGAETDAVYTGGELRQAAICYALGHSQFWPDDWDPKMFKPTREPIRDLIKAGALIAAEIDRLLRDGGFVVAGLPAEAEEAADKVTVLRRDLVGAEERRREMEQTIREMDGRIAELNREVGTLRAEARSAMAELDDANERSSQLHLHSSRLVELLADAWWVEAAHALGRLRELTGVD